jgi:NtrC-family two-component system response regulator AlgB
MVDRFTPEALAAIRKHSWPGNIRELRNAIERGTILASGTEIGPEHLPVPSTRSRKVDVGGTVTLEDLEAEHIRRVLAATPSLDEAAVILGIDASTLYRKRKKLGL